MIKELKQQGYYDPIQALREQDFNVRNLAQNIFQSTGEPRLLPYLCQILVENAVDYACATLDSNAVLDVADVISVIQQRCRFYSYEIFQAYLEAQKADRQTHQNSNRLNTTAIHATEVKIFENVDRYYEPPPLTKDLPS
ncbi:hypothetical protein [Phormidesmis priestleyi]